MLLTSSFSSVSHLPRLPMDRYMMCCGACPCYENPNLFRYSLTRTDDAADTETKNRQSSNTATVHHSTTPASVPTLNQAGSFHPIIKQQPYEAGSAALSSAGTADGRPMMANQLRKSSAVWLDASVLSRNFNTNADMFDDPDTLDDMDLDAEFQEAREQEQLRKKADALDLAYKIVDALQNTGLGHDDGLDSSSSVFKDSEHDVSHLITKEYNKKSLKVELEPMPIQGVKLIADALELDQNITHLEFSLNSFSDDSVLELARMLQTNEKLQSCWVCGNYVSDTGAQALAKSLAKNKTLTELNLQQNDISQRGVQALAQACCGPASISTLSILNLSVNEAVGDEGVVAFTETVLKHVNNGGSSSQVSSLSELNFSSCKITDVGACALARLLDIKETHGKISIESLDLSCNHIGEKGLIALMDALEDNSSFRKLLLHHQDSKSIMLTARAKRAVQLRQSKSTNRVFIIEDASIDKSASLDAGISDIGLSDLGTDIETDVGGAMNGNASAYDVDKYAEVTDVHDDDSSHTTSVDSSTALNADSQGNGSGSGNGKYFASDDVNNGLLKNNDDDDNNEVKIGDDDTDISTGKSPLPTTYHDLMYGDGVLDTGNQLPGQDNNGDSSDGFV